MAKKEIGKEKEVPFEDAIEELEAIVAKLEAGDVPLDDSLKLFERGAALSQICSKRLNEAEQRIVKITAARQDGEDGENEWISKKE